jgi:ADP-heptose:LPS heptosyltransferase
VILISPYARSLRNGEKNHPKNYPHWDQLIPMLLDLKLPLVQTGSGNEEALPGITDMRRNLPLPQLANLIKNCDTWISVDSFFQHYAWHLEKRGVVLWGQSDPVIVGHPENINLLKDRKYLREKQFWMWEQTTYQPEAFVGPEEVLAAVKQLLKQEPV